MIPPYKNRLLASDIEANDLLENVTKVWCLFSIDVMTQELLLFHDYPEYDNVEVNDPHDGNTYIIPERTGTLEEGVEFWRLAANNGSKLIVHNGFKYDKLLIKKFWPDKDTPDEAWHDTLLQSKLQWQARPAVKGSKNIHGLDAYGCRFGIQKPPINDWSFMDAYKLHRCLEDCKIQRKTYLYLEREAQQIKEKLGIDFSEGLGHEVEYTGNTAKQEARGCPVDVPFMEECVKELDEYIVELSTEIEPQLPPTLKLATSTKVSIVEMCGLLGIKSKSRDKVDSEGKIIKTYYKPTVNFTREDKTSNWGGFNITYGSTPAFRLKKEVVEYIKETYPDEEHKDWELEKIESSRTVLNKHACNFFDLDETATDIIVGPHTRIKWETSTLSQHDVVKKHLVTLGWKPDEWNLKKDADGKVMRATEDTVFTYPPKALPENQTRILVKKGQPLYTSPKLTEKSFESLPEGLGKDIANYNTYQHRRRFLKNPEDDGKGLLNNLWKNEDRFSAGVNVFGTATGRS